MSKVYEIVTQKIVEELEKGCPPWRKPWTGGDLKLGTGANLLTKKPYRGINALLTAMMPFRSPYFVTFKQAQNIGATIKKGSKGLPIVYWATKEDQKENDVDKKSYFFARYYTVFNVEQCDDVPEKLLPNQNDSPSIDFYPLDSAEAIARNYWLKDIQHDEPSAYYSPSLDFINLPKPETFHSVADYYATLFHELGHSTGHESRLNRKTLKEINTFGDHAYSKEELIAEITSAFLCERVGISQKVIENQAAYCQGWTKRLRGDSRLIVEAAQQAQKAYDLIVNEKPEQKLEGASA